MSDQAIRPLLEREASGLVHLLLSSSLKHTPLAALSRPVAGTIGKTLLVTLPGSVKAVKENMEALLTAGVVDHAVDLVKGGTGRQVHADMAKPGVSNQPSQESGHTHHHHHHHHDGHEHRAPQPRTTLSHDPSAPGELYLMRLLERHRSSSILIILSFCSSQRFTLSTHISGRRTSHHREGYHASRNNIAPSAHQFIALLEVYLMDAEQVNPELREHVLAVNVHAPQNVPLSSTTSVDGYALRGMLSSFATSFKL
jgi:gephyrin